MTRLALMLIVLVTGALSAAYGLAWVLVSHDGPSTPAAAADPVPVSAQAMAVARVVHRYHHHPAATHTAHPAAVAHPVVAADTRPSHHATVRPGPPAAPAKVVTHTKPAPAPKPKPAPGKHHHGHHQHGTGGGGGDGNGGNGNGSVIGRVVSTVTGVLSVLTG
jgi:hypothetical protein